MTKPFGEMLRRMRIKHDLSQQQLADKLHVSRSSVANWEVGRRIPDAATISQIAQILDEDVAVLLATSAEPDESPNVLLIDDNPIILGGGIPVLQDALPGAHVVGFLRPTAAVAFFKDNPVAVVFLDIEMGRTSGLDLCRNLLQIKSRTNIIYLTAFREYSFDAWDTGASGFLLKPLDAEDIRRQIPRLRYPVRGLL